MRIVALYAEDYPWDVRVDKLFTGLVERGHVVTLVCRNEAGLPARGREGVLACRRVPGPGVPRAVRRLLSLPAFFNPLWRSAVMEAVRAAGADLLVVRDVPLAPLAVQIGRRAGIPVVIDMAENHPAMWRNVVLNDPWRLPSLVLKNPRVAAWMEGYAVRRADGVFVVVEEMRERLVRLGVAPGRIAVVSNTPRLRDIRRGAGSAPAAGPLSLVYVGCVTLNRGLQTVIKAMAIVQRDELPLLLHIVGDGPAVPALRRLVSEYGQQERVSFHGWVDHGRLPDLLGRAHVGVVPHLRSEHTETTIPNKLFDYMASGLPVLTADPAPLARIVRQEGCGLVYADRDPQDCARALRRLADGDLRRRLGNAAAPRSAAATAGRSIWPRPPP